MVLCADPVLVIRCVQSMLRAVGGHIRVQQTTETTSGLRYHRRFIPTRGNHLEHKLKYHIDY